MFLVVKKKWLIATVICIVLALCLFVFIPLTTEYGAEQTVSTNEEFRINMITSEFSTKNEDVAKSNHIVGILERFIFQKTNLLL
ncbi:hypothetical protein [Evansella halocellulosilytica]|uniref:hypothetical protein n=1 Tax=Evansella halocellulosilytica TaxID=2011013 RepID=UPI000BB7DC14|nr:hypothetical protein [Evansella halocellulosilytica]